MPTNERSFCDFCSQPIADEAPPVTKSGGVCCPDCAKSSHFERRLLQEITALVQCVEHLANQLTRRP